MVKRKTLDNYLAHNLSGNVKHLVKRLGPLESRFDYLVFVADIFEKQVNFDLADVYYENRFDKIHNDIDQITALRLKLETGKNPLLSSDDFYGRDIRGLQDQPSEYKIGKRVMSADDGSSKKQEATGEVKTESPTSYPHYDTWARDDWKMQEINEKMRQTDQYNTKGYCYFTVRIIKACALLNLSRNFTPRPVITLTFENPLSKFIVDNGCLENSSVFPLSDDLLKDLLSASMNHPSSSPVFNHYLTFVLPYSKLIEERSKIYINVYHAENEDDDNGKNINTLIGSSEIDVDWTLAENVGEENENSILDKEDKREQEAEEWSEPEIQRRSKHNQGESRKKEKERRLYLVAEFKGQKRGNATVDIELIINDANDLNISPSQTQPLPDAGVNDEFKTDYGTKVSPLSIPAVDTKLYESVENPFNNGLINGEESYQDHSRVILKAGESIAKTKKTLEELRNLKYNLEDKDGFSSQLAVENLKNTLTSSELFKIGRSSNSKVSRPKTSDERDNLIGKHSHIHQSHEPDVPIP